jgi:hypothetical protein
LQQQHEQTMQERSTTATDRRRRRCREALAVVACEEELDTSREYSKRTKLPALLSCACDRSRPVPFHVYPSALSGLVTGLVLNDGQSVLLPMIQRAVLKTHFLLALFKQHVSPSFSSNAFSEKKKFTKKRISLKKCIESHPVIF